MESKKTVISVDNVPAIIRDTMTAKDLRNIEKNDAEQGLKYGVTRLLNLLPIVGGALAGEIELAFDIQDACFFRNYIAYLYGLNDTTEEQRKEFLYEIEKTAEDYSGNVIAGMISRIDNINKGKILSNLTKAKIYGEISIEDFFRITTVVERIPYADFKYLSEFRNKNYISGGVSELLFSAGVISQTGIDGNVDHDWFELSPIGTKLMKFGLGYDMVLKGKTKTVIPQLELIDDMEV